MDGEDRAALGQLVWDSRYRHRRPDGTREADIAETQARVAAAVASVEGAAASHWRSRFLDLLGDFRFLPGGRILAGAGTGRRVTLCNCFVMGTIDDSLDGIFSALGESALTLQQGGGIGCDFSTLRPAGRLAAATGRTATGPLSFMRLWDRMCEVLVTGSRRGAMMGVLHAAHPDIADFIRAKAVAGALSHFNLSVLVRDAFLQAVRDGGNWALRFPCGDGPVVKTLPAAELWDIMLRAAYACGEPGVVFIDRVNRENNLHYCEELRAVNPCGELPLPPYGACVLGSLNLVAYVQAAFSGAARLDLPALARDAALAVRFLDDTLDLSHYPLPQQQAQARATRRVGLGITGLADALVMLGLRYDSAAGRQAAEHAMATIADAACLASVDLAREKGGFPRLDAVRHADAPFMRRRAPEIAEGIRRYGIRNSHLLAIAPAGSISLLAGNVSSGLEPVFARDYERRLHGSDGQPVTVRLAPCSLLAWRDRMHGGDDAPPALVVAEEVAPLDQLRMQAVLQRHVDNAISKTVTVPAATEFSAFRDVYEAADSLGLKGCAVYRSGTRGDAVMHCVRTAAAAPLTAMKG